MGWRTWGYKQGKLHSPMMGTKWQGPSIEAVCADNLPWQKCLNEGHDPNDASVSGMLCGVHSTKEPSMDYAALESPLTPGKRPPPIFGTVMHHGTVLEGQKGYRSSKATIHSLWAPKKYHEALKANYPGVQVYDGSPPGLKDKVLRSDSPNNPFYRPNRAAAYAKLFKDPDPKLREIAARHPVAAAQYAHWMKDNHPSLRAAAKRDPMARHVWESKFGEAI